MSLRKPIAVALVLSLSLAVWAADAKAPAKPDEVESLIAKALAAHKAGKTADAIAALQKAISIMQQSLQKGLAAFFPAPPAGWTAGKIKSQSLSMGSAEQQGSWVQVTRTYTETATKARARMSITNSPQLIQAQKGMAAAFKNPQMLKMMNQNPDTKIDVVERDGFFGWLTINKKSDTAEGHFLGPATMLTIEVRKDDGSRLQTFVKALDLKGLAKATATTATQPVKK